MGRPRGSALTSVERSVLQMLWEGLSLKEVAAALSISHDMARYHRKRIGQKLGQRSQWQLARYVVEHGLVTVGKVGI